MVGRDGSVIEMLLLRLSRPACQGFCCLQRVGGHRGWVGRLTKNEGNGKVNDGKFSSAGDVDGAGV